MYRYEVMKFSSKNLHGFWRNLYKSVDIIEACQKRREMESDRLSIFEV